jgi:hypothetical protein
MVRMRLIVLLGGLLVGLGLNLTVAPQIMTPRPPVFNGADIAANWEWRSMAIGMQPWWMWQNFPDATVTHVGYVPPVGNPEGLAVGMKFSDWVDQSLGLAVDETLPPLDLTATDLSISLEPYRQLRSRIDCRVGQEMTKSDTCYYLVAYDPATISSPPEFVGVLLSKEERQEEFGVVERGLLESLLGVAINDLRTVDEVRP